MPEPLLTPVEALLLTVAAERDRIAGELHDDSIQAMTVVSLILQRLRAKADDDTAGLIDEAREATDTAIARLRHMLFVLHPSTLAEDGLVLTVDEYLETYVEPLGITCELIGDEDLQLPGGVAALGFRLLRDAISNAVRHASATKISVTIERAGTCLVVAVRDDGRGFEAGDHHTEAGHLGLEHARALAHAALGTYEVTSAPGEGTTVAVTLPIEQT